MLQRKPPEAWTGAVAMAEGGVVGPQPPLLLHIPVLQLPEPPCSSLKLSSSCPLQDFAHADTSAGNIPPPSSAPLPSLHSKGYWHCLGCWDSQELEEGKMGLGGGV